VFPIDRGEVNSGVFVAHVGFYPNLW